MGRVDVLTGTLGKALGGASGGYVSGARAGHRLAPPALAALPLLEHDRAGRRRVDLRRARPARVGSGTARDSSPTTRAWFRARLAGAGFRLLPGEHPIIPVMIGDAALAVRMADRLLELRRVRDRLLVPGRADGQGAHPHPDVRGHTRAMLEAAAAAFVQAGRELGIIGQ